MSTLAPAAMSCLFAFCALLKTFSIRYNLHVMTVFYLSMKLYQTSDYDEFMYVRKRHPGGCLRYRYVKYDVIALSQNHIILHIDMVSNTRS